MSRYGWLAGGVVPVGGAPVGAVPDGVVPEGAIPEGAVPVGAGPAGAAEVGAVGDGVVEGAGWVGMVSTPAGRTGAAGSVVHIHTRLAFE